jgi:hypothetical protein
MSHPAVIDSAAAKAFFKAAASTPSVTKVLSISAYSARRKAAPWWTPADIRSWKSEIAAYPDIHRAKTEADECLANVARARGIQFQAISLRPTWFGEGREVGKVKLGKTGTQATVPRAAVAEVAVALLCREDTWGWYDLSSGSDHVADEIGRAVVEGIDCIEGEDPN